MGRILQFHNPVGKDTNKESEWKAKSTFKTLGHAHTEDDLLSLPRLGPCTAMVMVICFKQLWPLLNYTKPNMEDLAKLIRQDSNIDRSLSAAGSQDTQYRRRCEVTVHFDMVCSPRQKATVAQPILTRALMPLGQALRGG